MLKLFKQKTRTFCENSRGDLDYFLDTLSQLEDDVSLTVQEQEAVHAAALCMMEIMNRMQDGKKVQWDA